jgi:hypothetical protein
MTRAVLLVLLTLCSAVQAEEDDAGAESDNQNDTIVWPDALDNSQERNIGTGKEMEWIDPQPLEIDAQTGDNDPIYEKDPIGPSDEALKEMGIEVPSLPVLPSYQPAPPTTFWERLGLLPYLFIPTVLIFVLGIRYENSRDGYGNEWIFFWIFLCGHFIPLAIYCAWSINWVLALWLDLRVWPTEEMDWWPSALAMAWGITALAVGWLGRRVENALLLRSARQYEQVRLEQAATRRLKQSEAHIDTYQGW